ncbi:hypothetical protein O4_64 [Pseudomonas phage O4]|nr:hypothetical protein BJD45_gp64 [Pseudomonas phage O4]AMO43539.1 hypothetical protein O4_64 [Pseudomonas phage O4]
MRQHDCIDTPLHHRTLGLHGGITTRSRYRQPEYGADEPEG